MLFYVSVISKYVHKYGFLLCFMLNRHLPFHFVTKRITFLEAYHIYVHAFYVDIRAYV